MNEDSKPELQQDAKPATGPRKPSAPVRSVSEKAIASLAGAVGPIILTVLIGSLFVYDRKTVVSELQRNSQNVVLLKTAVEVMHNDMKAQVSQPRQESKDPVDIILEQFKASLLKELPTRSEFTSLRQSVQDSVKTWDSLGTELSSRQKKIELQVDNIARDTAQQFASLTKEIGSQGTILRETRGTLATMRDDLIQTAVNQRLATVSPYRWISGQGPLANTEPYTTTWRPLVATWDVQVRDGVVKLNGTAPDQQTGNVLINAASSVAGVKKVDSQIKIDK